MIRYSHVRLQIPCDSASAATITAQLGVQPTAVEESKVHGQREDGSWQESTHHAWVLDSPLSQVDGDPTTRLSALADIIEPFALRLPSIRPHFRPFVDIVYHVTPQRPNGVMGEFDWFTMPAELMRRYGAWDLCVSYESFWFDHPDWVSPKQRGWWRRMLGLLRIQRTKAGRRNNLYKLALVI
ncbi:MAG TPA: hypothetical protein VGI40_24625 [Pirellulaceae bacterium]|jgi:hypothetical protein